MRAQHRGPRGWFSAARRAAGDDTGASLVIVLILITVVALVVGSVLLFSDTGIRATVGLRSQASQAYSADSAAQVAVDKLRTASPVDPTFGCTSGLLSNMQYPAIATATGGSATVTCTVDNTNSQTGFLTNPNSGPGSAMLSLGTGVSDNITIAASLDSGLHVTVNGGIFSNTTLSVTNSPLQSTWTRPGGVPLTTKSWIIARQPSATTCAAPKVLFNPSLVDVNCNYGSKVDVRGIDPGLLVSGTSYNQTAPTTAPAPVISGVCSADGKTFLVTVQPAAGQTAARFTAIPTFPSGCGTQLVVFKPAVYYFDFSTPTPAVWQVPGGPYFIGGTTALPLTNPTAIVTAMKNNIESACVGPLDPGASVNSGVEFMFSANSSMAIDTSSGTATQIALCASSSAAGPPIAIYSPRTAASSTSTVSSANCPKCGASFKGTIYTPSRPLSVTMNNGSTKTFAYGIYAKSIRLDVAPSSKFTDDFEFAGGIPEGGGSPVPVNYLVLKTYVCPAQSTCAPSGPVRLTSKVLVSGYIQRTVSVLSWAAQR